MGEGAKRKVRPHDVAGGHEAGIAGRTLQTLVEPFSIEADGTVRPCDKDDGAGRRAPAYKPDLVIVAEQERGRPKLIMMLDVQLRRDNNKRTMWPQYATALRARRRCPVMLVVVCVDAKVASWASRPIVLGPDGNVFTPHVIGPGQVPRVTEPEQADGLVELAVLSAVCHASTEHGVAIAKVALDLLRTSSGDNATRYRDVVMNALPPGAREELEAM
ncbi:MAG: hypothetical protein MUF54_06180 [Polyangiaceae bacterium]|jgi:hypothetical protein|nr:hypothetical protein [Polyangiaceae bacterium]